MCTETTDHSCWLNLPRKIQVQLFSLKSRFIKKKIRTSFCQVDGVMELHLPKFVLCR